ncbi:MAG: response regulator [Fibrobacteria bacterium]|nr:response regulator [Fibrobacteria bacterium]
MSNRSWPRIRFLDRRERLLAVVLGGVVLLLLVVLDGIATTRFRNQAIEDISRQADVLLKDRSAVLMNRANLLEREVRFLAETPPIQGLARAKLQHGLDQAENSSTEMWRNRLIRIFQAYVQTNTEIMQLRLIGLDEGGKEIVRVDRIDGKIVVVPDDSLQRKADRDYFQATLPLASGEVHMSELDLNVEHGRIQVPFTPTLRASTPVRAPDGSLFGMVVVNLDARPMLKEFRQDFAPPYQIYLCNAHGDFLSHPFPEREFGTQRGQPWGWTNQFGSPPVRDTLQHLAPPGGGRDVHLLAHQISYSTKSPRHHWWVITTYPDSVIDRRVTKERWTILSVTVGILVTGSLILFLYLIAVHRRLQIQETHSRLGAIVDGSGDAILGLTLEGTVTSWNRAARKLFPREDADVLGRPMTSLLGLGETRDQEEITRLLSRASTGILLTSPPVRIHPDPSSPDHSILVAIAANPVLRDGRTVDSLAVTLHDITDQEKAREEILTLNANLEAQVLERTARIEAVSILQKAILEHASWAILATDREGVLQVFNPAASAMLGWSPEEVLGRETLVRFHDAEEIREHAADLEARGYPRWSGFPALVAVAEADGSEIRDWTWVRKDGSRLPVVLALSPLQDAEDRPLGFISIAQDLTERHRIEAQLRQRTEEAVAAGRAKSEFLANMSHEIRTPLNGVLGLASVLETFPLDPEARDMVRKIRRSGDLLRAIIDDILDMSKIEAGRLELDSAPFRLEEVLESLSGVMGSTAGAKDIELVIGTSPPEASHLVGDSHRLEQILVNLTGNAIKFTSRGSVEVGVEHLGTTGGIATLRFFVKDTGIGIPSEKIAGLFEAFAQADSSTTRRFGGTGLGLAITRMLVEKMGGRIEVESEVGAGSTFQFTITLPILADAPTLGPSLEVAIDGSRPLDFLVADDNEASRQTLSTLVQSMGWSAVEEDGGEGAMRSILKRYAEGHPFDVLLLDWKMPDLDGLSVAREIHRILEEESPPIILLATAYSLSEMEHLPEKGLVDAILTKPVTGSSVHNAIQNALHRRAGSVEGPKETSGKRLEGMRILMVDDNDVNRDVVVALCGSEGAEVDQATDGEDALRRLGSSDLPDVVLMDVQMPGMDGYQATRAIRENPRWADLPVVALSAGVFQEEREAALAAGMNAFVPKPFDPETLFSTLETLATTPKSSPRSPERPSLPPLLDTSMMLAVWKTREIVREKLRRFAEHEAQVAQQLRKDLDRGEESAACFILHRLRGTSGVLGLPALSQACLEFERAVRAKEPHTSEQEKFEQVLSDSLQAIADWPVEEGHPGK